MPDLRTMLPEDSITTEHCAVPASRRMKAASAVVPESAPGRYQAKTRKTVDSIAGKFLLSWSAVQVELPDCPVPKRPVVKVPAVVTLSHTLRARSASKP